MSNELDPQVKALLEQFHVNAAQHPAPSTPFSAKEKIIATRQMIGTFAPLRCPSESVSRAEAFDMLGPAGKVPVRLYVPHTKEYNPITTPVFVYYHGGGFVAGDLESHDTLLRALANRAQCIVISVAYPALRRIGKPDLFPFTEWPGYQAYLSTDGLFLLKQ